MQIPASGRRPADHAEAALRLMREHEIEPMPANYQVFYTYAAGANKKLSQTIDILFSNKLPFSDAVCNDLSHQFFQSKDEASRTASVTVMIGQLLSSLKSNLSAAGLDASQFGQTLNTTASALENNADVAEVLKPILNVLAEATRQMEQRNQNLEQNLQQSGAQLDALHEKLEAIRAESLTDPLTEIGNRRAFDNELRKQAMNGMETGDPLCLLLLDIDRFKLFNDTHGHPLGDQVLRLVASLLAKTVADKGFCARFGGEEFAAILPRHELAQAVQIANIFREAISGRNIVKRSSGEIIGGVTVSIGAALFRHGEPLSTPVERTDTALYAAKQNGRNRIVCEDELARLQATGQEISPSRNNMLKTA